MTQNEIIEIARQAGFAINELHCSPPILTFVGQEEAMEAFAKLVEDKVRQEIIEKNAPVIKKVNEHIKELQDAVKSEREACVKICDEYAKDSDWPTADNCAETIRARGNT